MEDSKLAWTYLEKAFQTNTITDTMVVLNKCENLRMLENQDVVGLVYGVLRELKDIGYPQRDTVVVHKILNRLPACFIVEINQNKFIFEIK